MAELGFIAASASAQLFKYNRKGYQWDQQQLSFHLAMTLLTVIILGIVYLRFVMPDVVVVKHRRNKYITSNDTEAWKQYEV